MTEILWLGGMLFASFWGAGTLNNTERGATGGALIGAGLGTVVGEATGRPLAGAAIGAGFGGLPDIDCKLVVSTRFDHCVHFTEDMANQGQQLPGLKGRLSIFNKSDQKYVDAAGNIIVEVYDTTATDPAKRAVWRFDAESLKRLKRKDAAGDGYTLFLPWQEYNAKVKTVSVQVRYEPTHGTPVSAAAALVNLCEPMPVPAGYERGQPPYRVAAPDILFIESKSLRWKSPRALAGDNQIRGEHLIRPDGTISLGMFGSLYVKHMTVGQIKIVIEKHLSEWIVDPRVAVEVRAGSSRQIYVVLGKEVIALPAMGGETVLDALSRLDRSVIGSATKIWVERPNKLGTFTTTLPIDWKAIVQEGLTNTNYLLYPGDRIHVSAEPVVQAGAKSDDATIRVKLPPQKVIIAPTPLTVAEVIALSEHGATDDIIIRHMEATSSTFLLTTNDLLHLLKAGVSGRVIREMQERRMMIAPTPVQPGAPYGGLSISR